MASNDKSWENGPERPDFSTIAAHAGASQLSAEGAAEGAIVPSVKPIYQSTTYIATSLEEMDQVFGGTKQGYVYGRYANPTSNELEKSVALLEGGDPQNAVSFGSGMAAVHSAMLATGLSAGDRVVASSDVYGQTWTLLNGQMRRLGVDTIFVDATNLEQTQQAIEAHKPRFVIAETMSNPLLKVADLPSITRAAHAAGALMIVDNTFATPYLVNPLSFGVDLLVHSATKYLSGHGDTMGGVVVGASRELGEALRAVRRDTGAVLAPNDAWLITRGIRTLPLRVQRQCENAQQVAQWLASDARIDHVNYPGLEPRPLERFYGIQLAGAMLSFVIKDASRESVYKLMESLRLVSPATTLGDLATLMLYPVMSSHRWLTQEARDQIGITDGLVRLSVGIESVSDIIGDLEQALNAAIPSGVAG
jgi:cystathionine beta-lyase/cystathionine gamma-synthase